jgi:DNA-binding transcriptional regulator LsrR (DeoR family)
MNPDVSVQSWRAPLFVASPLPPLPRRIDPDDSAIRNFARLIGAGATARLMHAFGGRRLYIRANPRPDDPIASAIGQAGAERLASVFGGERVWLPRDSAQVTREQIAAMRRRGTSVSRIAAQLGISDRYVYKVLAQIRADRGHVRAAESGAAKEAAR